MMSCMSTTTRQPMAGNVYEWTLDVYDSYSSGSCNDYADTSTSAAPSRGMRGGSFTEIVKTYLRVTSRLKSLPAPPNFHVGVRCARGAW